MPASADVGFCCASCGTALASGDGELTCPACAAHVPLVDGVAAFTATDAAR